MGRPHKQYDVEIRFVPISKEEGADRSKRLMNLLLNGAIRYSQEEERRTQKGSGPPESTPIR